MSSIRLFGAAALAVALGLPVAALAQQAPPPAPVQSGVHHRHHGGMRTALQRLDLSPAQRSQIDQIFAQRRGVNKGADRATRRANREKLRAQIDAVLTPAQRTRLQAELRAQHRGTAPTAPH